MNVAERRAMYGDEDALINDAIRILSRRLRSTGQVLNSPATVRNLLFLQLAGQEREHFHVLFLDVKNRLIANERMFTGTLTHTSVYPREVVKRALDLNSASVMLAHNHPSGKPEPSEADLLLTRALQQALALVDVRLLDHFIVGGTEVLSFAEEGKL